MKNVKKIIVIMFAFLLAILAGVGCFLYFNKDKLNTAANEYNIASATLESIDMYQKRYFDIVKRNNLFFDLEGSDNSARDVAELKKLFEEVKAKIDKNCPQYIVYEEISTKYRNNTGRNTLEMNDFAKEKYDAFDKLLNDTYKAVKDRISENDFILLKESQRNWLHEVEDYNKIYLAQGFGTIGTLIKFDYEINMRAFRTLLLMLYLN